MTIQEQEFAAALDRQRGPAISPLRRRGVPHGLRIPSDTRPARHLLKHLHAKITNDAPAFVDTIPVSNLACQPGFEWRDLLSVKSTGCQSIDRSSQKNDRGTRGTKLIHSPASGAFAFLTRLSTVRHDGDEVSNCEQQFGDSPPPFAQFERIS
jgi:hypothetical protein